MERIKKELVSKANSDATTRELNAKARVQAQKDMKTVNTVNLPRSVNVPILKTGKEVNFLRSVNVPITEEFDTLKNAIGVKQHDKKAEKTPKTPKVKKVTLASRMDDIIHAGGKWEAILVKANEISKSLGTTTKFNIGTVKAHIAFRTKTQKNADYLGALKVTELGIVAA